ncbi:MAG: hypoxanthine phosphoribosyltransferase [bacterium]
MMNNTLYEILLDQETIRKRVRELGVQITSELGGAQLCLCPLLDGGMIFAADLMREITLPMTLLPLKASSYGDNTSSSGIITLPWGIPGAVAGKEILLVDDILDTGRTLQTLQEQLLEGGAISVRTCVLLRKEYSKEKSADFVGFEIPDKFVVGYGLDLAGYYRNLPHIGIPNH